jgi:competence protein ComEA
MKKLSLAVAMWFAAAGVAGTALAADKADEKKAPPAAAKSAGDTKAADSKAPAKAADTKAADTKAKDGGLMVNINKASKDELKALKGIGDTRAQDIIDYRKKNGDFKSVDDLEKVKGIGPGTMKQIRANITVTGDTMIPKKAEPAKDAKAPAMKDEKAKAADTKAPAKEEKKAEKK